ncbi:MAG: type II secretion system protein, partial [Chthoniobacterales bacterium]
MFSLCRQRIRNGSANRRLSARLGFTLVEITISLAVIGTLSGASYIGFNAINA